MHISNLNVVRSEDAVSRHVSVVRLDEKGALVRYSKKSGEEIK
ncbi:MAG: hypothetical protein ACLRS8_05550 [Parabacteroides merdae]